MIISQNQVTALDPLKIGLQLRLQTLPDAVTGHHQRQLGRIPALLAHKTPVAAGLLKSYVALFTHHHRHASFGQIIGGRTSDDTAPHNHHVGRSAFHWHTLFDSFRNL